MNIAKKMVRGALESGLEALKDRSKEGGKQLVDTVNPVELVKTVLNPDGSGKSSNEVGDYLKNLADPSLQTQEAIQTRQQEEKTKTEQETERLRNILHGKQIAPAPQPISKERIYDKLWNERQEKEAAQIQLEGQKPFADAAGKKKGRLGGPMHQKASTGMETKVNVKTG